MTFDDWWNQDENRWELAPTAPFFDITKAIALYAWNVGFTEGYKKAHRNHETTRPDLDKEE